MTTEERLYLHAARLGDYALLREMLDLTELASPRDQRRLNVNSVDYMGRNALHLAVDSESVECIELLLDTINWECQEEVCNCITLSELYLSMITITAKFSLLP